MERKRRQNGQCTDSSLLVSIIAPKKLRVNDDVDTTIHPQIKPSDQNHFRTFKIHGLFVLFHENHVHNWQVKQGDDNKKTYRHSLVKYELIWWTLLCFMIKVETACAV